MRAESARSAPRAPRAGKKGNRVGDRSFSKSVTIRTAAKHAPNASYFEVPLCKSMFMDKSEIKAGTFMTGAGYPVYIIKGRPPR